ncbi:hypothetical protein F5Y06DRAFT_259345 [Hypoxylon sp. FL0890]|nr:hypothetical protein F5Y06DRAFT_259345 [Hypoxylon sp. FL0890]
MLNSHTTPALLAHWSRLVKPTVIITIASLKSDCRDLFSFRTLQRTLQLSSNLPSLYHTMQTSQFNGGQFEDRLRNLILSNTDQTTGHPLQASVSSTPINTGLLEDRHITKEEWQKSKQPPVPAQTSSKASKKRPNQAQRRQMQAQLSIPIDTRTPALHDVRPMNSHQYESQRSAWQNPEQNAFLSHSGTPQRGFRDPAVMIGNERRHQGGSGQGPASPPNHRSSWRHPQPPTSDSFSRGVNVISPDEFSSRGRQPSQPALYPVRQQHFLVCSPEQVANQSTLLDELCHSVVAGAEIEPSEIVEKENFRVQVEAICRDVISRHEIEVNGVPWFQPSTVQLKCFGSLSSGFATKTADMDLGLLSPMSWPSPESSDSPIPRLIEKALLEHGFGARLLTRTRVPIIKLCEKPNEQLRLDLLEARAKWEKGLADDSHEAVDDAIDDQDISEGAAPNATTDVAHSPSSARRRDSNQVNGLVERTYEEQLAWLKQSETQSLLAYYGIAKRLLRRLNGRDITNSNAADFKPADYKLLDDVSVAFVNGLYDKNLKCRVQSYPSFQSNAASYPPNLRSLAGVFAMVEGEKIVIIWETQVATDVTSKLRCSYENTVRAWKTLQNKRMFGTDPLLFNRELHVSLERLRQIPFVQLIQLKQEQYESPTQYHSRVVKIAADLGGSNSPSTTTGLPEIIQYYISGIRDKQVRDKLQKFATSTGVQTLRAISRKHKTIHLVADFERAIEKGLYHGKDLPLIREYMKILQEEFVQRLASTAKRNFDAFDFTIPATESTIAIVNKIKQLPDPSKLAPNQPRDRYHDSLEFPKNGVGVQCDINFSAHLALQNTLLLRCYAYTDPRVRPMVLFVKHWAKARGINTPYRGTLSSYGYVLMVLHYLVNIAEPFVCPNLQQLAPPNPNLPAEALEGIATCKGRNIRFWRDEQEIQRLAREGHLNQNRESLGSLLRGFFEYYAQNQMMSFMNKRGFDWGRDVLSLRTHGGLLSKQEKGWTGAKTVMQLEAGAPPNPIESEANTGSKSPTDGIVGQQVTIQAQPEQPMSPSGIPVPQPTAQTTKTKEFKEVRHRFLFAIEDPFELEHNVARTVTHNGIVSIRDEFRRAWRIIRSVGETGQAAENLLQDVKEESERMEKQQFAELLDEIHGLRLYPNSATF